MIDLPIVRLYATSADAQRALDALRRWGFEPERIVRLSPSTTIDATAPPPAAGGRAPDGDAVSAALRAASIPDSRAAPYVDAVRRGRTLLIVHAPFGTGGYAEDMLEDGAPVDRHIEPFFDRPLLPSHLAAPLSGALGLPTLARRGRTTSEALGLPTVTRRGRTTSEALGIPAVTNPDRFTFGAPRLSDQAAPLSRALGLPVLGRRGRTLGEVLGLPELTRRGGFVFGAPRLSDSAAPFSALLGLPVLIRERHGR